MELCGWRDQTVDLKAMTGDLVRLVSCTTFLGVGGNGASSTVNLARAKILCDHESLIWGVVLGVA